MCPGCRRYRRRTNRDQDLGDDHHVHRVFGTPLLFHDGRRWHGMGRLDKRTDATPCYVRTVLWGSGPSGRPTCIFFSTLCAPIAGGIQLTDQGLSLEAAKRAIAKREQWETLYLHTTRRLSLATILRSSTPFFVAWLTSTPSLTSNNPLNCKHSVLLFGLFLTVVDVSSWKHWELVTVRLIVGYSWRTIGAIILIFIAALIIPTGLVMAAAKKRKS